MNTKSRIRLLKVLLSSMFLALAVIAATFISLDIPLFGVKGVELNPAGIFTSFPAILFGPFYGGLVAGLTDLISFFLKPQGAYIPLISLVVFIGGFLKGVIWLIIKKADKKHIQIFVLVLMSVILIFGVFNHISLLKDNVTDSFISGKDTVMNKDEIDALISEGELGFASKAAYTLTKYSKAEKYSENLAMNINFITLGFEIAAVLGLVLLALDYVIDKADVRKGRVKRISYIKILITVLVPGLIVTVLNTQVLIMTIAVFSGRSFLIVLIPRIIPSFISHIVQAYYISILYDIYSRLDISKNLSI